MPPTQNPKIDPSPSCLAHRPKTDLAFLHTPFERERLVGGRAAHSVCTLGFRVDESDWIYLVRDWLMALFLTHTIIWSLFKTQKHINFLYVLYIFLKNMVLISASRYVPWESGWLVGWAEQPNSDTLLPRKGPKSPFPLI